MTTNPYLAWPLWHYFTMNSQNIDAIGSDLTSIRAITSPILLSKTDNTTTVERIPSIVYTGDISASLAGGESLVARSNDIVLYDFMNDKTLRLSNLDSDVYLMINNTFQKNISKIPPTAYVILKGGKTASTPGGGDFIPFIGTPSMMNLLIQLIASTDTQGDEAYDIMSKLPEGEADRISTLLNRPIYSTASISRILKSYKSCSTTKNKRVNLVSDIRKKIDLIASGKVQPGKSINIVAGQFANSKNDKTIMEFKVKQTPDAQPVNVKFSFPQNISSSDRENYIDLLRKNFFAEQVHTPSIDERRATEFNPIRIETNSISSIFGEPEKFSKYIEKVNALERNKTLDTSATLSSLPSRSYQEEEEEDEDYEED